MTKTSDRKKSATPYSSQPSSAFWSKTVSEKHPMDISNWYTKKFSIDGLSIAAAGSCFAQHISKHLKKNRFCYIDTEPAPSISGPNWEEYGYGLYSARYGNIYTSRQLLQLLRRAFGTFVPKETAWEHNGGFVDPFRPTLEPEPFSSLEELENMRNIHLKKTREVFEKASVFIFTFGLTETWESLEDGAVFPVIPGSSAGGEFDPAKYRFVNLNFQDIYNDMENFISETRNIQPEMKFIFTVSPVPLVATATNSNVVVATTYSKSVLRAVSGQLAQQYDFVDYFPSYEIITSHVMKGYFYEPDMRRVASHGVEHVMKKFFAEHVPAPEKTAVSSSDNTSTSDDDVLCDEEILESYAKLNETDNRT